MIHRILVISSLAILISGCSILGGPKTKPVEIRTVIETPEIIQPTLPEPLDLTDVKASVVSKAVIVNPCKRSIPFDPPKFNDKGEEQLKRPKTCSLEEREHPDWPEGYTYLDRFLDEATIAGGGSLVFVAYSIKDYEVMSANFQELRRYIRELGEVIVYYREVTIPEDKKESAPEPAKSNDS